MAFERWQQQLLSLLRAVQTKQHQYDQASKTCQILLQPWPRKSEDKDSERKDPENKNENAQENPADPQEHAELKFVNDLLSKAQKTRVKLSSKISRDEARTTNEELASSTTSGEKQLWEICTPEGAQGLNKNPDAEYIDNFKAVPVIETTEPQQQKCGNSGNAAHTHHKRQPAKLGPGKDSIRPGSARTSDLAKKANPAHASVTKPTLVADSTRSKSIESAGGMRSQPRPKSGHGKVKPAHLTAPFQTNPNLHAPRRKGKGTVFAAKVQNSAKNHIHSGVGRHQRSLQGGDTRRQMKVLPPITPETAQPVSSSPDEYVEDSCETPLPSASENTETVPSNIQHSGAAGSSSGRDPPSSEMSKLNLLSDHLTDVNSNEGGNTFSTRVEDPQKDFDNKQDIKRFSLLSQGANLNIPPKVRRAFAKNQQLRNKLVLRDEHRRRKSSEHDMGQEFADKLQQLFDAEEEVVYRQQALECLHTHQRLADILQCLDLESVTELSSPSDVLRAKLITEFVLSSFSMYSEDANLLSKVQFPATPSVPELVCKLARHKHCWLPEGDGNQCMADRVHYTAVKDLHKYMDRLLQVQTLKHQQHLLQVLVADILPWLQNTDFHHEDFGPMYRGIFSLLVTDGNHMPALIQDSL